MPNRTARLAPVWLRVLRPLLQLTDLKDPLVATTEQLRAMCAKLGADLPFKDIRDTLNANGIRPKETRMGSGIWLYKLSKDELRNLAERYDPEGVVEAKQVDKKPRALPMAAPIVEGENDDAIV